MKTVSSNSIIDLDVGVQRIDPSWFRLPTDQQHCPINSMRQIYHK